MNPCNLICGVNCIATGWLLMNPERILQPLVLEKASQDTQVRNTGTHEESTSVL